MVNSPLTQVKRDLIRSALAVVEGNRQKERKKTKTMLGGGGWVKEKKRNSESSLLLALTSESNSQLSTPHTKLFNVQYSGLG
jgi:hypothetical protein